MSISIQVPPLRACVAEWPVFIEWMIAKMTQDAWGSPAHKDLPVDELTFRGHRFTHCPFCGRALNMHESLLRRHP